jgi:hypothetical protein
MSPTEVYMPYSLLDQRPQYVREYYRRLHKNEEDEWIWFHISYMTTGSEKDMFTCRIRATQPTVCTLYVN